MTDMSLNQICAIILAAGYSSRMGFQKPLLPFGNTTILGHIIDLYRRAGIAKTFVVTGCNPQPVADEGARHGANLIYNPVFASGMFSSIAAGIKNAAQDPEIVWTAIHPADMPFVSPDTVARLLQAVALAQSPYICPSRGRKKGHPPFLSRKIFGGILAWRGDGGLQGFLKNIVPQYIEVDDPGIIKDVDTPSDYISLSSSYQR